MTLATSDKYETLPVCEKCGWPMAGPHEIKRHARNCAYVVAGQAASQLADLVPDLVSTKFGYGTGQLTFELDESLHITFHAHEDETVSLRELWLLDSLTTDEAADLVRAIAAWRARKAT